MSIISDQKVSITPEAELKTYYQRGQKCRFRKLTANQIKRLYFNWLKDDFDGRSFEEVFTKKFDDHEVQWRKQYNIKSVEFIPKTIGVVLLEYDNVEKIAKLTFTSARHSELSIMKPIKTHPKLLKWVRDKVNQYNDENIVEIDLDLLKSELKAPIETTILLF